MAIIRKTLAEIKAAPPRLTPGERAHLDAMTEEVIERNALDDPENPPWSDEQLNRAVLGRRVRQAREKLSLSQAQFAARYHIPIGTLRDWEQGRRMPDATAVAYLTVIERDHMAVERALAPKSG